MSPIHGPTQLGSASHRDVLLLRAQRREDAIAGLAAKFQSLDRITALGAYYFGMWEHCMANDMLWKVTGRAPKWARPPQHIAPTWSWASTTGAIEFAITQGAFLSKVLYVSCQDPSQT